ncbi:MAG: cytochrome d ubiquinol oxidase subunit II [Chlorobi bacterium]|nr:cytochrome d ubiquinol oxidase subunit II [Chlorobiota bacterium]
MFNMETLWYIILWALLGIYILLEGYEFGAGMVYLLFARTDSEKRKVIQSIRSIWDANEIWLVAFLALAYLVFPDFFHRIYEAFGKWFYVFVVAYFVQLVTQNLILIFFDRPFRKILDWVYGLANFVIVFIIGVFISNILRGNIGADMQMFSQNFSPFSPRTGYIDWFVLLFVLMLGLIILMHGLGWLIHKNRDAFGRKLKFAVMRLAIVSIPVVILLVVAIYFIQKDSFRQFLLYPALFIFPILMISSLIGLLMIRTYSNDNKGFLLATNLFIYFWTGFMILLYPYLIYFHRHAKGVSIFETEFHSLKEYYLQWWVIGIALLLIGYSILVFKYHKGKALAAEAG